MTTTFDVQISFNDDHVDLVQEGLLDSLNNDNYGISVRGHVDTNKISIKLAFVWYFE